VQKNFIHRAHHHYHHHLDLGRQVAFRALVMFLLTFGFLRALTYVIHYQLLPIGNIVTKSGLHIHHLFWGILLLIAVGFAALATRAPTAHLRIAIVFGIALALTLDEFALWLHLADVYWDPKGRESVKAVFVAAGFLGLYAVGRPFWIALGRDFVEVLMGGRKRR
jgi:hypothetical protein